MTLCFEREIVMSILEKCKECLQKGQIYELQAGVKVYKIEKGSTTSEYALVQKGILDDGYVLADSWEECGSHFATYQKGNELLYIALWERSGKLQVISDRNERLVALDGKNRAALADKCICSPLLTQVRMMYYAVNCGMSYIIRLTDGRFVIIDGGDGEYEESEHLLELLKEQNVLEGKPQVAAWFFTHPHDDHVLLFHDIMKNHRDELQIESLVYSWASPEYGVQDWVSVLHNEVVAKYCQDMTVIQPHTGQRLIYPGVTFSVLYVHEDMCPEYISFLNDTSLVMRMDVDAEEEEKTEKRRVMFFGDALQTTADVLCAQYEPGILQCEMMQVAHHGFGGGSPELYRMVDPEVVLWPLPDYCYLLVCDQRSNSVIVQSEKADTVYMGGSQEVTIDLWQSVLPSDKPYEPYEKAVSGDVLYEENFGKDRIFDLHWSCIYTATPDYAAAKIALENGECHLESQNKLAMIVLMEPGMFCAAQKWTVALKGRANAVEEAFLTWNYVYPEAFKAEEALPLPMIDGEEFDFQVSVDCDAGKAILTNNGNIVQEFSFPVEWKKGLYFVIKNGDITMKHIRVVKD